MATQSSATTNIAEIESRTVRLVRNRCLPVLMIAFVIAYLDRVNVGFAGITANKELGLNAEMFGRGASLLFLSYSIFELPSNLALQRFGARRWISLIMVAWGLVAGANALMTGPMSFYIYRFALGVAEAGFLPGALLYLTYWFPQRHRARLIGIFALATPFSSVVGSPISGYLLGMNGVLGVKGWQWLYVLEAVPAVLLGIFLWFYLTDRPAEAKWLAPEDREWLVATLEKERIGKQEARHIGALQMVTDGRVLALAAIFFLTGGSAVGLSIWMPQMVNSFGGTHVETGFISALPFLIGALPMVWWGRRSDRMNERAWHIAIPAFVAFLGLAIAAWVGSPAEQIAAICFAGIGVFCIKGPMLALISEVFADTTAAAGIAWTITLGSTSSFFSPYMVGIIVQYTKSYRLGMLSLGIESLLGVFLVLAWAKARSPRRVGVGMPAE